MLFLDVKKECERYQVPYNGYTLLLLGINLYLTRKMASEPLQVSTICVDVILSLTSIANYMESIYTFSNTPLFLHRRSNCL